VLEGPRYSLGITIADDQSPTVGSVRGQITGTMANILGYGDVLAAQYGRSFVAYSTPIASDDTRLNLRYDKNGTLVVSPALVALSTTSNYTSLAAGLSRPFYRTAEQNLTLGLSLEYRQAQTFLLGMPFSFTNGAKNGSTNVTALRFSQDWLDRDAGHAFAARSTLSFGLPIFGATVVSGATTTAQFFSWFGQAQYVRRVFADWEGAGAHSCAARRQGSVLTSPAVPLDKVPRAVEHRGRRHCADFCAWGRVIGPAPVSGSDSGLRRASAGSARARSPARSEPAAPCQCSYR
jgi:hemolysin activation/secretion protein